MKTAPLVVIVMMSIIMRGWAVELPDTDNDGIPDSWEIVMGLSHTDALDAASDTDHDGLTAQMEYALGGSTTANDAALLPRLVLVPTAAGTFAEFTFYRRHDNPCTVVQPELATNLGPVSGWSATGLMLKQTPVRLGGGIEEVVYRTTTAVDGVDRRFLRARLTVLHKLIDSGLGSVTEINTPAVGVGGSTTLTGNSFAPGQSGNAAVIGSAGDMIEFPVNGPGGNNLNLMHGEVEFWFKPDVDADDDTNTRVLFALGDYLNPPNLVLAESNRLSLTLTTATRSETTASAINAPLWRANEWVHIRAAWDSSSTGDSLQIFVNGRRIGEATADGGWDLGGTEGSAPTHFYLGSASAAGAFPAGGCFDSLMVRDHRQAWEQTNNPPSIPPLDAHWLVEGEALNFTAMATDPDGHTLTWSLDSGAPPGAFISPTTGAFTYTPAGGTAPSFFDFRIRVTDDGTPRMSASSRITIGVAGNDPPVLTNLTPASQNTSAGGTPTASFDWQDVDGDIVTVRVTTSNVIGTETMDFDASAFAIKGFNGQAMLKPVTQDLPYGTTQYSVRLIDSQGNMSGTENFTVNLVGAAAGSTTPVINSVVAAHSRIFIPLGPLDVTYASLDLTVTDPDHDAKKLRIKSTIPGGQFQTNEIELDQLAQDLSASPWTTSLKPFKFRHDSVLGSYQFELTVIDADGNASNAMSASVNLVPPGFSSTDQRTPYISFVEPEIGQWGDPVIIYGIFPDSTVELVTVELGGQECEIVQQSTDHIEFIIPDGAFSGAVIVRGALGAICASPATFPVNPQVDIYPLNPNGTSMDAEEGLQTEEVPKVLEGTDFPLEVRTTLPAGGGGGVTWRVNAIPGGNLAVGTITSDGLYHAPDLVNAPLLVTVSATLNADPDISDSMSLCVVPRAIPPGGGWVRAAAGGVVPSRDGRTRLEIPAGALAADTTIQVTTLANMQLPSPRPGAHVLAAVNLQPSGLVFSSPVTLTLPLNRELTPGSMVPVLFYNESTMQYVDEGIVGTVSGDGANVTCQCTHFSTYVVDEPTPAPASLLPPVLDLLAPVVPAEAIEGARLPVLFTGTDLHSDLMIEIYDQSNQPVTEMSTGPVHANTAGTQAGTTLFIGGLPALPEGASHNYKLRLVRPGIGFAEASFTVNGLNEFILTPSSVVNLSNEPARTYSEVFIPSGAVVRVVAGSMDFTSTGPIIVEGTIDASGDHGAAGNQRAGGNAGAEGGDGGLGQDKAPGSFFLLPFVEWDEATIANRGKNGNVLNGSLQRPAGYGGDSGRSVAINPVRVILTVIEAIGTGGLALIYAADEILSTVNAISDLSESAPTGRRGLGASLLSGPGQDATGGGGGGGGGLFEVSLTIGGSGVTFSVDGGGGGAGGNGGRDVRLRSASSITVNGLIDTHGGNGGDGSTTSNYRVTPEVLGFDLPSPETGTGCPCMPGGGGGGGRGGRVHLIGNEGVAAGFGSVVCNGGKGGMTGFVMVDPENRESRFECHRNWLADGPALGAESGGPVFDPAFFRTKTTNRRIVRMEGLRSVFTSGAGGGAVRIDPISVAINRSPPPVAEPFIQQSHADIEYDASLGRYHGAIVLQEGWNHLTTHLDRTISILVISVDSDGDGLSDADEADIGTLPNDPDTDDDGLNDGQELVLGTNPLSQDTDSDGLGDFEEVNDTGTDPRKFDSDDDGFSDSVETLLGSDPLFDQSKPQMIPVNTLLAVVTLGDGAHLAIVDPASSQLGILGRPAGGFGFGIACDSFADVYVLSGSALSRHNPLTGETTPVGTLTGGLLGGPLAFNPVDGMLYSLQITGGINPMSTGQLLRIDPLSAVTTAVGAPQDTALHGLAFRWDGRLVACKHNAIGGDDFVEINPATGALIQTIGQTGETPLIGLTFSRDQVLYATQPLSANDTELWSLNETTAVPSSLQTFAHPLFDLTVTPAPAPSLEEIGVVNSSVLPPELDLASGDFNNDGHMDIVTLSDNFFSEASVVQVYLGDGTGALTAGSSFGFDWDSYDAPPQHLDAGDLNGDGIPDIAVATTQSLGVTWLLLSDKDITGAYTGHHETFLSHGTRSQWAGIASMNPSVDAHLDIVVATADQLIVFFNDGTGESYTPVIIPGVSELRGSTLALGDLNHDGFPDIVGAGFFFLNNGGGTFGAVQSYPTGAFGASDIAIGDVNFDTHPDIVHGTSESLNVLLGNGSGSFGAPISHGGHFVGSQWDRLIVGDFDGNGTSDVLGGNYETGFDAYFRAGTGAVKVVPIVLESGDTLDGTSSLGLADLTGDGIPEVIAAHRYRSKVFVYRQTSPFKE